MFERRSFGLEVRAEGRRLSGTVLKFGDVSPSHRERFEAGSIRFADAVHLDLHHDPERAVAWFPDGGLKLSQSDQALTMRAELPPIPAADRALAEIRSGRTTGLSVEFKAIEQRKDENGLRVVQKALLSGIGLVRAPSYQQSKVEARAKSGRTLRASVPYDRDLACECIAQGGSGSACVPMVKFAQAAGEGMAQLVRDALKPDSRDVLAVYKDYSRPLASARKGTLRAVDTDDGLAIEVDLPTGEAGDMAVAASEAAGVLVRPLIDYDADGTSFVDTPTGRVVNKAAVKAFLIGSTDSRRGWDDATIDYTPETASADALRQERRKWLWL